MHPIIALWSHPRSMSTAIERIMRERGDLDCAHEPFMYDYYVARRVRVMPLFEVEPDRPADYEAIRDHLLARAEVGPVFFKDMSYYVVPRIFDDPDFAGRLTNAFLIRDPLQSILSYHKLDPELTSEEIGLEAQWRHFEWLLAERGTAPVVLDAEAVRQDSVAVIGAFWRQIGLADRPQAFSWSDDEKPKDWGQVAAWHGAVGASSGIRPAETTTRAERQRAFEARAAEAPTLLALLAHHQPFYERLSAHALTA